VCVEQAVRSPPAPTARSSPYTVRTTTSTCSDINTCGDLLLQNVALLTAPTERPVTQFAEGLPHAVEALKPLKSAPTITWNAVVTSPILSVKRPETGSHGSLQQTNANAMLAVAQMAALRAECAFLAHHNLL
jgi:hypothetical protein